MCEKIVLLNEEAIKGQPMELARDSVEEPLNKLLEVEAQKLTKASRYEKNEQHQSHLNLTTISEDVTIKVAKIKRIFFEITIIY